MLLLRNNRLLRRTLNSTLNAKLSMRIIRLIKIILRIMRFPYISIIMRISRLMTLIACAVITLRNVFNKMLMRIMMRNVTPINTLTFRRERRQLTVRLLKRLCAYGVGRNKTMISILRRLKCVALLTAKRAGRRKYTRQLFMRRTLIGPSILTRVRTLIENMCGRHILRRALLLRMIRRSTCVTIC